MKILFRNSVNANAKSAHPVSYRNGIEKSIAFCFVNNRSYEKHFYDY